MSVFGKILAGLNVLAAFALLAVAAADFANRQAWAVTAFKHEIALRGLPLADDGGFRLPGEPAAERVSVPMAEAIFNGARGGELLGGGAVRTQHEEVERIAKKADQLLGPPADLTSEDPEAAHAEKLAKNAEQRRLLGRFLLYQASSPTERIRYIFRLDVLNGRKVFDTPEKLRADPETAAKLDTAERKYKAGEMLEAGETDLLNRLAEYNPTSVANLKADLAARCKHATQALARIRAEDGKPAEGGKRERDEQRAEIARLLYSIDVRPEFELPSAGPADPTKLGKPLTDEEYAASLKAEEEWRTRVQRVVGIKMYTLAGTQAAAVLADASQDVRERILSDQRDFIRLYDGLIRQLPDRAEALYRERKVLADKTAEAEKHQVLVNQRDAEKTKLTEELNAARAATASELERQRRMERYLFEVQRRLGDAQDRNVELEKELRRLELGR